VPTAWLEASLTTFGRTVASYLPGHFDAYARLYHPFEQTGATPLPSTRWRELAGLAGRGMPSAREADEFATQGVPGATAHCGNASLALIDGIIEHLRPFTGPSTRCYFAVWDGFGDSILPPTIGPTLQLPNRDYHVFEGSLEGARASWSRHSMFSRAHQSANLWWPADHAWCVATEIDFQWTYIGGPRACIDAILADPELEAVETFASARW